jgi:hypothetical protein
MVRPATLASSILLFSALLSAASTTTTTLSSTAPAAPAFGQTVTLIATVSPPTAPGFVAFLDRGVLVGTAKVNASGIAQAATITLAAGPHSLVARYGGNTGGGFLASQSAALPYIVTASSGAGFPAAGNYLTGLTVKCVAVGDFNGDGKADVAAAISLGVTVMLGDGSGHFPSGVTYPAGSGPTSAAVGDFNGDGKLDLAVADAGGGFSASGVSVLLGNGDGTFQAAVNYGAGGSVPTTSVVVGDFNGDGIADLVAAGVGLLLGNGDGTFQAPLILSWGTYLPMFLAAGDFDGDGNADLAGAAGNGGVVVLLGNGNGTFKTAVYYTAGVNPVSVAVGDFNEDGYPDLAVPDFTGNNVNVLIGNGNGTFQTAVPYAVGAKPAFVVVGDFNGDGKPDLAVANFNAVSGSSLSVLLGYGTGAFRLAVSYGAGASPISLAVGDFNGDGREDLAAADNGGGG